MDTQFKAEEDKQKLLDNSDNLLKSEEEIALEKQLKDEEQKNLVDESPNPDQVDTENKTILVDNIDFTYSSSSANIEEDSESIVKDMLKNQYNIKCSGLIKDGGDFEGSMCLAFCC